MLVPSIRSSIHSFPSFSLVPIPCRESASFLFAPLPLVEHFSSSPAVSEWIRWSGSPASFRCFWPFPQTPYPGGGTGPSALRRVQWGWVWELFSILKFSLGKMHSSFQFKKESEIKKCSHSLRHFDSSIVRDWFMFQKIAWKRGLNIANLDFAKVLEKCLLLMVLKGTLNSRRSNQKLKLNQKETQQQGRLETGKRASQRKKADHL